MFRGRREYPRVRQRPAEYPRVRQRPAEYPRVRQRPAEYPRGLTAFRGEHARHLRASVCAVSQPIHRVGQPPAGTGPPQAACNDKSRGNGCIMVRSAAPDLVRRRVVWLGPR
jgi:hypothetical protein